MALGVFHWDKQEFVNARRKGGRQEWFAYWLTGQAAAILRCAKRKRDRLIKIGKTKSPEAKTGLQL